MSIYIVQYGTVPANWCALHNSDMHTTTTGYTMSQVMNCYIAGSVSQPQSEARLCRVGRFHDWFTKNII